MNDRRPDTLDQIERRLDEITRLHGQLTTLRQAQDAHDAQQTP
jgi:hypothetical protein